MKKLIFVSLFCAFIFSFTTARAADGFSSFDDIDALMEENALTTAANRYSSVLLSYYPERATLAGFESANDKLDQRTPERDAQALRALQIVRESLTEVNANKLTPAKKADYAILKARVDLDIWNIEKNQNANNPLYYAQVFDSIYDLALKQLTSAKVQDRDLTARANALEETSKQAAQNLVQPPTFLSQIAMEKAYYAYLAYDEIAARLTKNAQDDVTRAQIATDAQTAKKNIKILFENFKTLAQENNTQDFRLGQDKYYFILENQYFIAPQKLGKTLEKNWKESQKALHKALEPFAVEPVAEMQEEVLIISDLNADPTLQAAPVPPLEQPKKIKKGEEIAPSAQDFYSAVRRISNNERSEANLLTRVAQDTKQLTQFFAQNDTLPTGLKTQLSIREMPAYFAYTKAALFVPPYGAQTNPSYDFFLRLPSGNTLNKQAMLSADFNQPTRKLLLTAQLIPGRYFQAAAGRGASSLRDLYPVPTLQNGWSVYAQHLAKEKGYIVTDQELLYLAWADYNRALKALLDYQLHTQAISYTNAIDLLTKENGFEQADAENMLKTIAAEPGEAVSYIVGQQAITRVRNQYEKKLGKKFSLADFHAKLLGLGAIAPAQLESEMENAYLQEKTQVKQALSSPFYM